MKALLEAIKPKTQTYNIYPYHMKKIALWMLSALLLTACGSKSQQMPDANNDYAVVTVQTTEADLETS